MGIKGKINIVEIISTGIIAFSVMVVIIIVVILFIGFSILNYIFARLNSTRIPSLRFGPPPKSKPKPKPKLASKPLGEKASVIDLEEFRKKKRIKK